MSAKIVKDYYIKRKEKLMNDFSKELSLARDLLIKKFDVNKISGVVNQMKSEYEKIIPEIPYIGGNKNPFTAFLVGGMSSFAMFQVLEKEGLSLREIGEFYYKLRDKINTRRKENLEKIGKDPAQYPFELTYVEFAKKLCESSRLRNYPDDWVGDYVEGEDDTFEWGFDFYECGIHKVLKRMDAERFVPLFCLSDFSEANILGFGFSRTQTIGFGAPICDHRYVKSYKTPKGWPPDKLPECNKKAIP